MSDGTAVPEKANDYKKAVRDTYNINAAVYSEHTFMQHRNLEVLAEKIFSAKDSFACVLDIGAGSGFSLGNLDRYERQDSLGHLVRADISEKALLSGPLISRFPYINVCCDAERLPFVENYFDLVYANSVLHWLEAESGHTGFERAIHEALRVTKPGGIFAASIAAAETSRMFFKVYESIMRESGKKLSTKVRIKKNPIGAMELHTVVDTLLSFGAGIISAELVYEPVLYSSAKEYLNDVKAYGYHSLLSGVDANLQSILWNEISQRFLEKVGPGDYLHDQYMIYVLASIRHNAVDGTR